MTSPRAPKPKSSSRSPLKRPLSPLGGPVALEGALSPVEGPLRRLRVAELPLDTVELARFLIGAAIVSDGPDGRVAARLVETEAYLPDDEACHAFRGETARNATLFRRRGLAYVYFIYGNHFCLNVSSGPEGVGAGVLLRAAEPLCGIAAMKARRNGAAVRDLCRGPGRLAAAFGITRAQDGIDLCAPGPLWLAAPPRPERLGTSVRIGLTKATQHELRFYKRDSPYVSGPAALRQAEGDGD